MSYILLFLWWVGDVWFLRDFGIIGATFHTLSLLILAGLLMDGMLRDIRYLPKVTQLHSDLGFDMNFELQPRCSLLSKLTLSSLLSGSRRDRTNNLQEFTLQCLAPLQPTC